MSYNINSHKSERYSFNLQQQFVALHKISVALCYSLDLSKTLEETIQTLHDYAFMQYGMVCLLSKDKESLFIEALHGVNARVYKESKYVRYRIGEGILGTVISKKQSLVLRKVSDDPRFLHKLNIYDYNLPFICVHIPDKNGEPLGLLAVQPMKLDEDSLPGCTRFLEMVANLIAHTVRLLGQVDNRMKVITKERDNLQQKVVAQYSFDNIVGKSQVMSDIFETVKLVAKWDTSVLINGESGTGKELIANAIHYNSPRATSPFVKFNCAALPDTLLESELFGHEKGAFTGAIKQRKGRFELANGGTLFLDEIGESSPMFQTKLLRILQEGEMERVGGDEVIKVDVRIIAATNRDLEEEVRLGHFRSDLYFRLNVMPITLPPLRERTEDIVELAIFLLTKIGDKQGRKLKISDGAIRLLMSYEWPGNVRELENTLERASVMTENGVIDRDIILLNRFDYHSTTRPLVMDKVADIAAEDNLDERQKIIAALEKSGWVKAKAARLLGMTPRQIAYRIEIMNIHIPKI